MEPNQQTTQGLEQLHERLAGEVECEKCHRIFKSEAALRMHTVRKHSNRGWQTGQNFRGGRPKPKTPEQIKQHKRLYQKRLRERYWREGKNSRGQQMPPGWKPRPIAKRVPPSKSPEKQREYYIRYRDRTRAKKLAAKKLAAVTQNTNNTQEKPRMNYALAADAVVNAAHVLQAVALGMKLTQ